MEIFSELENAKKYGEKNQDVITRLTNVHPFAALSFCLGCVAKYGKRYNSDSAKARLESDVIKMADYTSRSLSILHKLHKNGYKNSIDAINSVYFIKNDIELRNFADIQIQCEVAIEKVFAINFPPL